MYYALVVATGRYDQDHGVLPAAHDAARTMIYGLDRLSPDPFRIRAAVDRTGAEIRSALDNVLTVAGPDDVLVVYVAGLAVRDGEQLRVLTRDGSPDGPTLSSLQEALAGRQRSVLILDVLELRGDDAREPVVTIWCPGLATPAVWRVPRPDFRFGVALGDGLAGQAVLGMSDTLTLRTWCAFAAGRVQATPANAVVLPDLPVSHVGRSFVGCEDEEGPTGSPGTGFSRPDGAGRPDVATPAAPQAQQQSPPAPPSHGTPSMVDTIQRVVREVITPGRLMFNPPAEMRQGRSERVEVGIARSALLDDQLRAGLRGRGVPQIEHISTAPFMTVELRGSAFEVQALSPPDQLVAATARWEYDVLPLLSGQHMLQLCVTLRIGLPDRADETIAVPVFEHPVRVRLAPGFGTRRFVRRHWQWIAATIAGLGGAIGAWLELFAGR